MDITLAHTDKGTGFPLIRTGFPLILLHGNNEDRTYFTRQIEAFSSHSRVIAIDTRGHGGSPRGEAPFTLAQFAEDLHVFLDTHAITKADILGFSDGGNIALLFALQYPSYVNKLILNGANLDPGGVRPADQIKTCLSYAMLSLIAPFVPKAKARREMLGLMVTQPCIKPEEISRLTMPVLVIAGKKDMIKESHTRGIQEAIKGSELRILDGDHFIASKNWEDFNTTVTEFISR